MNDKPVEALVVANPEPQALEVVKQQDVKQPLTSQQAKIDAVANVLYKAYEKASSLMLTREEIDALAAEFPDDAFRLGAGGDDRLLYIEHAHLRDRFNGIIGMGQWSLVPIRPHWSESFEYYSQTRKQKELGTRIYAQCALLIRGCFVAEAIGSMDYYPNNQTNFADAAEGAETAAFRRCAKKFGVGLQAWKKDFCEGWMARNANKPRQVQIIKPAPAPPKPVVKPAPVEAKPIGIPETPQQRKAKFLAQFKGYESYAVELWTELGLLLPGVEGFDDFPINKIPDKARPVWDMVQEVKKRAGVGNPPADPQSDPAPSHPVCPNCNSTSYIEMRNGEKVHRVCQDCGLQNNVSEPQETVVTAGQALANAAPKDLQEWKAYPIPQWSKYYKEGLRTFGELDKNQLWWFCVQWHPKAYTDKRGKTHQPSVEDYELRGMLDKVTAAYGFTESKKS